ncbi:MAG TPA: T9SS type A sorting domain-containing protein, partial [Rhodothermales bacterium]|nr:T9SS type A sorting domain-containing protein [Rhodothermales bacterium]
SPGPPQGPAEVANYPNPFTPATGTTIAYELAQSSRVRISLYDLLGRRVAEVLDEQEEAGPHSVRFDGAGLASGTYICRIDAGGLRTHHRVVLVR